MNDAIVDRIIRLRRFGDRLTCREIAEDLGVPETLVHAALRRRGMQWQYRGMDKLSGSTVDKKRSDAVKATVGTRAPHAPNGGAGLLCTKALNVFTRGMNKGFVVICRDPDAQPKLLEHLKAFAPRKASKG